jgi:hypothetical protein
MNDENERVAQRLSYDATAGEYSLAVDWAGSESISTTLVLAVESLAEGDDIEPLVDRIDPDALDSLFEDHSDSARDEGQVTFPFGNYSVTLDASGDVRISPPPEDL